METSHAQTGGQPFEAFLLGEKNKKMEMVFFVREENWSGRFFDRAETTATAQNCKQFKHFVFATNKHQAKKLDVFFRAINTTRKCINLDCDLLNSEIIFCNEKTPNQTRPDVFSRTINTTCKCMKLDCDL